MSSGARLPRSCHGKVHQVSRTTREAIADAPRNRAKVITEAAGGKAGRESPNAR